MAGVIDLLFADQDLDELLLQMEVAPSSPLFVARSRLWEGRLKEAEEHAAKASDHPFAPFAAAMALVRRGDVAGAKKALYALDASPTEESRMRLWAWRALRAMGEVPAPAIALDVLGVVVEVPMRSGLDVLAAYADGSARYVNYDGGVVALDPDPAGGVAREVAQVLADGAWLISRPFGERSPVPVARDRVRFSALTRSGIHSVEATVPTLDDHNHALGALFAASAVLLGMLTSLPRPSDDEDDEDDDDDEDDEDAEPEGD